MDKRRSTVWLLVASYDALKTKLGVLAAVKIQNCHLKKVVSRKSTIENKLSSKLGSAKKEIMTSNAMIRKLTVGNLLLRKESSEADVQQLKDHWLH